MHITYNTLIEPSTNTPLHSGSIPTLSCCTLFRRPFPGAKILRTTAKEHILLSIRIIPPTHHYLRADTVYDQVGQAADFDSPEAFIQFYPLKFWNEHSFEICGRGCSNSSYYSSGAHSLIKEMEDSESMLIDLQMLTEES